MSKWPMVQLGEVISHRKEFIQIDDFERYKRCRVQLHARGIVLRDSVDGAEIKTKKQQVCGSGELLVAEIDAKHGGYGIVPDDLEGAIVSSHYFLFEIDQALLDRRFLGYYIQTPVFFDQVSAQGSTNYAAIRPGHVLEYQIPLPPLSEQQMIVEWIDAVATRVEEAKGLCAQSNKAQSAMRSAIISRVLDGLDFGGTLSDVLNGKPRNGWSAKCDGADGGVAVLSLAAVTGFNYRPDQFKKTSEPTDSEAHYWLYPGDLLITRSNTPELVGHSAIYSGDPSPCIYPDLIMKIPVDPERCTPQFAHYVLQSRMVRDFIKSNAKGTSPTMKKISQGTVNQIPFPANINLLEQYNLVETLDAALSKIDDLADLSNRVSPEIDHLLPSILNQVFNGGEHG